MMEAVKEKKKIRRQILSMRNAMAQEAREAKSSRILQKLYGMEWYQEAKVVLAYVNYQSEVITMPLLGRALLDNKLIFAPKVTGEEMEFYQITDMDGLSAGYKGILEPVSERIFPFGVDREDAGHNAGRPLMLLPGAVFDQECHRIGYGKGYYDRYLNRLKEMGVFVHTLALCYECQMLEAIPYEPHDIKPDMILTEKMLYKEVNHV